RRPFDSCTHHAQTGHASNRETTCLSRVGRQLRATGGSAVRVLSALHLRPQTVRAPALPARRVRLAKRRAKVSSMDNASTRSGTVLRRSFRESSTYVTRVAGRPRRV